MLRRTFWMDFLAVIVLQFGTKPKNNNKKLQWNLFCTRNKKAEVEKRCAFYRIAQQFLIRRENM